MQRLITKALPLAVATTALIATAVGIASTGTGQTSSNGHSGSTTTVVAGCWPGQPCWRNWEDG
ncbi:hypothetical protein AB0D34_44370 [Streptomyces sp. NPDC048420]|uniref:hypothetical protein n=1 Tax=Streptomyces sp. NPDC048420 TaxID=3155755 RepID=UPI00342D6C03